MKTCTKYSDRFISRFMDGQVSEEESQAFLRHLEDCAVCQKTLEDFKGITAAFQRHMDGQAERFPRVQIPVKDEPARPFFRLGIKLASLAAAALIMVVSFRSGPVDHQPSAIVDSIETDYATVMIIDAQDTGHTIIWFSQDLQEDHG